MLTITAIRHAWPEKAGFRLYRPHGTTESVFVHFTNSVQILAADAYITVPPHTCILYLPGTPQFICSERPLIHDWFHFTGDPLPLLSSIGFSPDTPLHPLRPNFVTDIVREMESEFFAKRQGYRQLLSLKIEELLLKLSRTEEDSVEIVDISLSEKLRSLRGEIFLTLGAPWTVEKMAASVGLSQSRFYTVYRSLYGNSPMDDLIRARVDSAKNALLLGNLSVSAIAESLGYNNVTHFIRQFRKITGMSPSAYRKSEKNSSPIA